MTKNVGQIKDVIIYDRSISKIFEVAIMGESNTLQLINFSPLRLNKAAFHQNFHVRISLVIVMNVTCKLPRIFTMIPIIIFVDRGRKYC